MADENNIGGKVGLDIGDFKANVAELNRQIKVIDSGFKAAAAGMDDWSSSEQGLQQRISALNQITDLQKQKVQNLTEMYAKIAAEKGESSRAAQDLEIKINKETEALNKNLKELNSVTNNLNNFGKESDQAAQKIDVLGKSSLDTGNSFNGLAAGILKVEAIKNIAGYAVDAAKSILGFSSDSTKAMNDFQAQTGYASDKMGEFKNIASEIYADNFGENINDIAESMAAVNQTTGLAGEELRKTTEQALLMRDTFGFEVKESVDTVNSLMANFGLTSEEAYNLIAQGAQMGANKNGDLLDIMKEYAPNFKSLGLSAEEFTDTLIQGSISGAFQIDKVGDAVKEFSIRSKDGSKTSADGFKALGLDADKMFATFAKGGPDAEQTFQLVIKKLGDMKDPLAQNQAGVALFGTMYEDLGIDAIKALGNIENYTDRAATNLQDINNIKYNNIGSALEGLKRQLIAGISGPIESEITPRIGEMVSNLRNIDLSPIIDGLGWIIDNANDLAAGAVAIGTGMATWNVVSTIQSIVNWYKEWKTATESMTVAQAALNTVQKASVIGIIITAVAALVAGLIYLWNTNEGFRVAVIGAWEAIKAAGAVVWGWLVNFFTVDIPNAFSTAIEWFSQLPTKAGEFFAQIPGVISNFLSQAIDKVSEWGSNLVTWVTTEIPKVIESIFNFFNELPYKIGYALGVAIGTVIKWGADLVNWVITEIPKIIANIIQFYLELPGKIASIFQDVISKIAEWGANVLDWIIITVPQIINSIVQFFGELPGRIATWFLDTYNKVIQWGIDLKNWASNTIPTIVDNMVSFFTGLPDKMLDIGVNIVKGLWEGIKSMISWLKEKITDFISGIVDGIKGVLGIHSPSRVFRDEVGMMIGAGLAIGIENSYKEVNAAMDGLNKQLNANGTITVDSNKGTNSLNAPSKNSQNNSTLGNVTQSIYVTVQASDLQQMTNVVTLFNNLAQAQRAK